MAVKKSDLEVKSIEIVHNVVEQIDTYLASNYHGLPLRIGMPSWWALSAEQRNMVAQEYRDAGWDARIVLGEQRDDAEYLQLM